MVLGSTRCRLPGSFASAWPELIIASDVRRRGEALPEVIITYDARKRGLLQTDGQKDRHHNQITYCVFRLYRRGRQKWRVMGRG